jgi:hypothetical protein
MPIVKVVKGMKWDDYKPKQNPLNKLASFSGCLVETFEPEYDLVRKQWYRNKQCIWTLIDGDDGRVYTVAGLHFVNRIGHIITEIPWESDTIEFDEDDRRVSN